MYSISWYIKFRLIWLSIVCIAYGWYMLKDIILLISVSLIISLALDSIITTLTKFTKHRIVAILIAYIMLLICMLMWIVLIIPLVIGELTQIVTMIVASFDHMRMDLQVLGLKWYIWSLDWIPSYVQNVFFQLLEDNTIASQLQSVLTQNISDIVTTSSSYLTDIWSFAVWFISNFVNIMFQIWLSLILAIFFSLEKDILISFVSSLFANKYHDYVIQKIHHLYDTMWLRLKGQFALCVVMALVVGLFLWILALFGLNLNHIFSLALIAWFTEFIPYVWPLLWSIPAILIATMMFGRKGFLIIWLWYFCIQWLENNILIPIIMKKTIGVNPLLIFLSMICAGVMMWLVWVILAVPIAQMITIFYHEYLMHKDKSDNSHS